MALKNLGDSFNQLTFPDSKMLFASDSEQKKYYFKDQDFEIYVLGLCAQGHSNARRLIVNGHDKLAQKWARKYQNVRDVAFDDLVQEARLGVLRAADKFDPEKNVRFSTYAVVWIKSQLHDYIYQTRGVVSLPRSSDFKRIVNNIQRATAEIEAKNPDINEAQINLKLAERLQCSLEKIVAVKKSLQGQLYLDARLGSDNDEGASFGDMLADPNHENVEDVIAQRQDISLKMTFLKQALADLPERERDIFVQRKLSDPPQTLETLAGKYNVSRERIRQIEEKAKAKIFEQVRQHALLHS